MLKGIITLGFFSVRVIDLPTNVKLLTSSLLVPLQLKICQK